MALISLGKYSLVANADYVHFITQIFSKLIVEIIKFVWNDLLMSFALCVFYIGKHCILIPLAFL